MQYDTSPILAQSLFPPTWGIDGDMPAIASPASLDLPDRWQFLEIEDWRSPLVLIGGVDSGKTTFARYCYRRLLSCHPSVGFIDLDVGQNSFGLPSTVGLGIGSTAEDPGFPPLVRRRQVFVGSVSPVGVVARLLAALHRLLVAAAQMEVETLVVDTSGFVDVTHGAADLKWAELEFLRPCTVAALQREAELTSILEPLAHTAAFDLQILPVSDRVQTRSREARRGYRARCYRQHFTTCQRIQIYLDELAVFQVGDWHPRQLVALEDEEGFLLALGLIETLDGSLIEVLTPWTGEGELAALRGGDLRIDPDTFQDSPLTASGAAD